MSGVDGSHRGAYEVTRKHVRLVARYLKRRHGPISTSQIAQGTALSKDQVKQAIIMLSFQDARLYEDDQGRLHYLR